MHNNTREEVCKQRSDGQSGFLSGQLFFLCMNIEHLAQRGYVQTKVRWAEWQIAAGVEDCEGSRSLTVRRMHDEVRDACSLGKFEVFSKNKKLKHQHLTSLRLM